eukprot:768396-Hanusia_phi.AAC.3
MDVRLRIEGEARSREKGVQRRRRKGERRGGNWFVGGSRRVGYNGPAEDEAPKAGAAAEVPAGFPKPKPPEGARERTL